MFDPDPPHGDAVLDPEPAAAAPPATEQEPRPDPAAPQPAAGQGKVSLNSASYEQLRSLGLSVTQTGRLLAHRERHGNFGALDDLDQIPGFSQSQVDELKQRIVL